MPTADAEPAQQAELALAWLPLDVDRAYRLLGVLLDGDETSQLAALAALREAGPGLLELRVAALLEATNPAVRATAGRALGASPRAGPDLVRRLGDPESDVAEAARDALVALGPAAWPALLDVPADVSDLCRVEALAQATRQGAPTASTRLGELGATLLTRAERQARLETWLLDRSELDELARAVGEERRRLARLGLRALGHLGDLNALDLAERALDSHDPVHQADGRQLAARLLGRRGARMARLLARPSTGRPGPLSRILEDALASESALVRAVAVEASGRILPPGRAALLLRRVATDPDPLVQAEVEAGLGRLQSSPGGAMLTTIEKLLFLRAIPTFQPVETEALRSLAELFAVQRYATGDVIFVEGEWGDRLYIVTEGQIVISSGGRDVIRLGPRHYFGEMALFDGEPRSATATAVQETTLLSLDRDAFYRLGRRSPDVLVGVIHVLSRRLRDANEASAQQRVSNGS
ncbi:MAG: cyclic nucleotide-binding domain-containing protein [Chloroflexi bacterium]|nr:cyclic nucleotide-binding domain-containing protein [Chloroflexota bacterium]